METEGIFERLLQFIEERLEKRHMPDPELVREHNADPLNKDWQIPEDQPWEQSDVVHDLLAYLAEEVIRLNKEKQKEMKALLCWLEAELQVRPDRKHRDRGPHRQDQAQELPRRLPEGRTRAPLHRVLGNCSEEQAPNRACAFPRVHGRAPGSLRTQPGQTLADQRAPPPHRCTHRPNRLPPLRPQRRGDRDCRGGMTDTRRRRTSCKQLTRVGKRLPHAPAHPFS